MRILSGNRGGGRELEPSYDLNVESVEDGQGVVRTWLSCLVYCAITFVMFYFAVRVFRDGVAILVTGFFAAFGVAYIVVAIRHTISRATFGDVKLLMEHPAPSVGGRLAGSVTLPRSALAAPTLVAELTCERETFGDKS